MCIVEETLALLKLQEMSEKRLNSSSAGVAAETDHGSKDTSNTSNGLSHSMSNPITTSTSSVAASYYEADDGAQIFSTGG